MKKGLLATVFLAVLVTLCSCGKTQAQKEEELLTEFTESTQSGETDSEQTVTPPDIYQIKSICSLATLECYFHNVAKSEKSAGTGITHWGETKRKFWIEYTGVAKVGIDMSQVKMKIDGTNVTITLPQAKILSSHVDDISDANYVVSKDSWNKNKITAEEQTAAVDQAQKDMESRIKKDKGLLDKARHRAKKLIENYINQLGDASGVKYNIIWLEWN